MGRRSKTNTLDLWMNGEKVGRWTVRPSGENEFGYDQEWLDSDSVRPISLSLPLRPASQPYRGAVVEAFFDNLLPDARSVREHMRRRLNAESTKAFDLLVEAGRDCVGALQLLAPESPPDGYNQIRGKGLTERDVENHLSRVGGGQPLGQLDDEEEFRVSLAGAQEKTALLRHRGRWMKPLGATPTTHILKLPIGVVPRGIDLSTSVENEWICARILAAYDMPVAKTEIALFGKQKVLLVERFDRRLSDDKSWIIRLPQEDFCQATGTPPSRKYESDGGPGIRNVMSILASSTNGVADLQTFFRAQIINWLLCAIDGHAKNYSLYLEQGGGYRLTPLYDVLSAYPVLGKRAGQLSPKKVKLAMAVEGKNRHYHWESIGRRHWIETARRCGLGDDADTLIATLLSKTSDVIKKVESELPKGFPMSVARPVLDGLRGATDRLNNQPKE
jgi:serine/threonine-protein kinase HipA